MKPNPASVSLSPAPFPTLRVNTLEATIDPIHGVDLLVARDLVREKLNPKNYIIPDSTSSRAVPFRRRFVGRPAPEQTPVKRFDHEGRILDQVLTRDICDLAEYYTTHKKTPSQTATWARGSGISISVDLQELLIFEWRFENWRRSGSLDNCKLIGPLKQPGAKNLESRKQYTMPISVMCKMFDRYMFRREDICLEQAAKILKSMGLEIEEFDNPFTINQKLVAVCGEFMTSLELSIAYAIILNYMTS